MSLRPYNVALERFEKSANAGAGRHWVSAANADSLSEMSVELRRAVAASGTEPAAQIRRGLGLPEYDEKDYS